MSDRDTGSSFVQNRRQFLSNTAPSALPASIGAV